MNILNREILKLAIPSILANITVPLVGIADIAVAGHLSGSAAIFIGGISIGSLLFDMLYWNFSFLRIGTGGMTAQAYGRDDMSAAAATLIRSVFVSMLMLRYRKKVFAGFSLKDARESFTGHEMKRFFNLNADLFIRSLAIMGIYAGITVISARYGDMMLAVSSILVQLMMIFSYFTDGFAYAGEALTGKFIGRRDKPAVRQTVRSVFAWSMGVAAVFMVLYAFFARPMLYVLTSDTEVVTASMEFIPWLIPMPIIGCAAFTWDGIYVGATASKPIRNSTLWAVLGFFIVWFAGYFILRPSPHIAVHILMAGFLVHLLIRMLYETVLYRRSILW